VAEGVQVAEPVSQLRPPRPIAVPMTAVVGVIVTVIDRLLVDVLRASRTAMPRVFSMLSHRCLPAEM
jgi:hypothetical protein